MVREATPERSCSTRSRSRRPLAAGRKAVRSAVKTTWRAVHQALAATIASQARSAARPESLTGILRGWSSPKNPRERSEEHTSELQSHSDLVCRLLLEKKKKKK